MRGPRSGREVRFKCAAWMSLVIGAIVCLVWLSGCLRCGAGGGVPGWRRGGRLPGTD